MAKEKKTVHSYEYKAEMKQLLNLIIHSLYTHREVFLRELISNACDALNKVRFAALTQEGLVKNEEELKITIEVDSKNKTFSIEDNGIGMTEEDLVANIGTVARSGTLDFLNQIKEQGKSFDENLIGQFGVGFYSVFMVTDEVTIETKSYLPESKGYLWKSSGEGTYTIEEIAKPNRGTKISFKLKEDAADYAQEYKVREVINKYSNYAEFPVYLKKEKVNQVLALWHKPTSDITADEANQFYKFLTNDNSDCLGYLHLSLEGSVNFKALIFVPQKAPYDFLRVQNDSSLHLYSNKILIQNDCKDLLPEYLRFVKGVVDTTDLPLNVSREVTQNSPVMSKISSILVTKILNFLSSWADNDKDKYNTFYKNFSALLKTGLNFDFVNRDKIIELLRFETSLDQPGQLVSLKEYVSTMKTDQKAIYYLSGDQRDVLESNPNLEYFRKKNISVFLLTDPVDVFTFPSIHEYDKKEIKSIDKADIDLMPEDKISLNEDNLSKSLIDTFREILKADVSDVVVSKRLVDSAVTLVSGKDSMDPQMEKMMKIMNKEFTSSKRILEVNLDHQLIKNLAAIHIADKNSPVIGKCLRQLYEGALFIDGNLKPNPDFVKRMTEIMVDATK
ncbi:MAG: molecular chaperone HtpG [Candidatus Omnitrophica bacterium]|nr:molecular chaperone HtpG [Candidatus Omnitrophota bacterium]